MTIYTDIYSNMKPRHFKIRNFRDDQSVRMRMPSQAAEEYPDHSDVARSDPPDRVSLNDLSKIVKDFMMATTQALKNKDSSKQKAYQVEPRDREVESSLPAINEGKVDQGELKRWISETIKTVYSAGFNSFSRNQMTFEQLKIYCSQNIFKNVVRLNNQYKFTAEDFALMDSHIKNGVLNYLAKKYPLTDNQDISKKFERQVHEMDNMEALSNNFVNNAEVVFEHREDGNYNDLIMTMINELMDIIDKDPDEDEEELPLYLDFEKYMGTLFENVEDEEWMEKPIKETIYRSLNLTHHSSDVKKENENVEAYKERMVQRTEKLQKYKAKVKQYTSYFISRKIPQGYTPFTEKEIENGQMTIKSPQILRILTKWCEQLWTRFEQPNYYSNHSEIIKVQKGGNVNSLLSWMRKSIDQMLAKEKVSIEKYMSELSENNYYMQANLLSRQGEYKGNEEIDELEKICGKFSSKVVQNLHSYIIAYLNRLIHGLTKVAKDFYHHGRLSQYTYWPSPPNLVSFRVGDLVRCRFKSQEREVLRIYRQLNEISRNNPDKLKIVRIKNRLKSGTNDVLINIRYNQTLLCEIQLSVNNKSSSFIGRSNIFHHYLYELQRSTFGPLTELCSIWISLDKRAEMYRQLIKEEARTHEVREHPCTKLNKRAELQRYDNPFICSQCNVTYFHNNYLKHHVKCLTCNLFICGKCRLEVEEEESLKNNLLINQKIRKMCGNKISKTQKLPNFGLCIQIESKVTQFEIFTVVNYNQRDYLLAQSPSHLIYQVEDISTPELNAQFRNKYLIFEYSNKGMIKKIKKKEAIISYILPNNIRRNYEKEKQSVSLMDLELSDEVCSQILTVGTSKQKENVKNLFLADNKLTKLPFDTEDFENIEWLTLSRNKIEDLSGIERMTKMKKLMMINCGLATFPSQLCLMKQLEEIILNENPLVSLPSQISMISTLKELSVPKCQLQKLPQQLGYCMKLKVLNLQKNSIEALPDSIIRLKNLEHLLLAVNNLTCLPECLGQLNKLETIDLRKNKKLKQLPQSLKQLEKLEYLDCSYTCVSALPQNLSKLEYLTDLRLNNACFKQLSSSIGDAKYLNKLNLYGNSGLVIPETIGKLEHLQELNISRCKLKSLPSSFYRLKRLRTLHLSTNELTEFDSKTFYKMTKLKELFISQNKLQQLPDLSNCDELQKLYCYGNLLTTIDDGILGNLEELEELSLAFNQLTSFPASIINMNQLSKLNISRNKLTQIVPPERQEELADFQGQIWPKLTEFNVDQNELQSLPRFICKCKSLLKFLVNDNKIAELPLRFEQLNQLAFLSMRSNLLTTVPPQVTMLSKIRSVDLSSNPITVTPQVFNSNPKFKKLVLKDCPLENKQIFNDSTVVVVKDDPKEQKGKRKRRNQSTFLNDLEDIYDEVRSYDDGKSEGTLEREREELNLIPEMPKQLLHMQSQVDVE